MRKQKLTIQAIKSKYLEAETDFGKFSNLWGAFVFRNISYYPTWLCLRLGVSANKITATSLIAQLIGFVFFAIGSYEAMIVGAVLINVWALLDYIDGNIARCTNSVSKYGAFLDFLGGSAIGALLFTSAGIGLFRHPEPIMNSLASYFPILDIKAVFLFLGGWASLALVLPQFIGGEFGRISSVKFDDVVAQRNTVFYYLEIIGFNLFSLSGVLMPLVLLGAILKFLSIVILAYALINTAYFLGSLMLFLKRGRNLDK